jgi:hypothetical protein
MKDFAMKNFSLDELSGMYVRAIEREAILLNNVHDLKKQIKRAIYSIEVLVEEIDEIEDKDTTSFLEELKKSIL